MKCVITTIQQQLDLKLENVNIFPNRLVHTHNIIWQLNTSQAQTHWPYWERPASAFTGLHALESHIKIYLD